MSIQAVSWALDQYVENSAAKLVLISLANCHNSGSRKCFPKRETIAKEASVSLSTVTRKIKWLVDNGFIKSERRKSASGGFTSNNYILSFDFEKHTESPENCTRQNEQSKSENVHCEQGGIGSCEQTYEQEVLTVNNKINNILSDIVGNDLSLKLIIASQEQGKALDEDGAKSLAKVLHQHEYPISQAKKMLSQVNKPKKD